MPCHAMRALSISNLIDSSSGHEHIYASSSPARSSLSLSLCLCLSFISYLQLHSDSDRHTHTHTHTVLAHLAYLFDPFLPHLLQSMHYMDLLHILVGLSLYMHANLQYIATRSGLHAYLLQLETTMRM